MHVIDAIWTALNLGVSIAILLAVRAEKRRIRAEWSKVADSWEDLAKCSGHLREAVVELEKQEELVGVVTIETPPRTIN